MLLTLLLTLAAAPVPKAEAADWKATGKQLANRKFDSETTGLPRP